MPWLNTGLVRWWTVAVYNIVHWLGAIDSGCEKDHNIIYESDWANTNDDQKSSIPWEKVEESLGCRKTIETVFLWPSLGNEGSQSLLSFNEFILVWLMLPAFSANPFVGSARRGETCAGSSSEGGQSCGEEINLIFIWKSSLRGTSDFKFWPRSIRSMVLTGQRTWAGSTPFLLPGGLCFVFTW